VKEIKLTQGKVALVDDEDFETLNVHKWHAYLDGHVYYVVRGIHILGVGWTTEKLHRRVLSLVVNRDLTKGEHCDHINGDGLDNQRVNLRVATKAQNGRNCRRRAANPASRYLGVTLDKRAKDKQAKKWQARVGVHGKRVSLGYYATEMAAAQAREEFILANPELCARTNFATKGD
jgi:hypothetical protein